MTVLIIEWTGVGGIAEASRSWYVQGREVGRGCKVLTTTGGVLEGADVVGLPRPRSITGYVHQVELVKLAVDWIHRNLPRVVVLQGTVMPHEEQRVISAARDVGARVVAVVYMPRPPFLSLRSSIGIRKLLRSADVLVSHTAGVTSRFSPKPGQTVIEAPFPPFEMSTGSLGSPPEEPLVADPIDRQLVLDVESAPKGLLEELAGAVAADGRWTLAVPDPPSTRVALAAQRSWLEVIGRSRAALIPSTSPYGSIMASVAMGLGVVPVVADQGAQAEQLGGGAAGILVPPDASARDWIAACEPLLDDDATERLVSRGFDLIDLQSEAFIAAARDALS